MLRMIILFPLKNKINNLLNICLLFIFVHYSFGEEECEKSRPIKKNNNCYLIYCTKTEFDQGICEISNSIVKTQWLTNIIKVGGDNFRLINFALSSKNDLIMHTRKQGDSTRMYIYGIKSTWEPYFNLEGQPTSVIALTVQECSKNYGEIIFSTPNNNNRELFVYFGKELDKALLFDYEKFVSFEALNDFTILTKRFFLQSFEKNGRNFYLAFIGKLSDDNKIYFTIKKCRFDDDPENSIMALTTLKTVSKENVDIYKNMVSCYFSIKRNIVCFYYSQDKNYTATIYNEDLIEKNSFDFGKPSNNSELFYKCIHFKAEMGIFYYFNGGAEKPIIDIVDFVEDINTSNYIRKYKFQSLTTIKDDVKGYIHINSIVKISENKFGIIQATDDGKLIYIIIFNIFNHETEIIARYYTINIYKLYNIKVSKDVDSILFNSFLACGFSFFLGDNDYENSHVIIFSYPNSNNYEINLINHLKENNYYFPLSEIIKESIIIENNIFGLVTKGLKFLSFPEIDTDIFIKLYSNKKKSIINKNQIIVKDEEIEFFFSENDINSNQYIIEYEGVVTEPDFDEFNLYCEIDSSWGNINNDKKEFKKTDYVGKTSSIILNVEEPLTNNCNDITCFFCLESDKDNCILSKKPEEYLDENYLDVKQLSAIYGKLKEIIEEKTFDGKPIILTMKDVLVQLSTIDFQEENIDDQNSTNVFLGECKNILKEKYHLQDNELLLMLKLDLFKQNSSTPLVEYEVYNYNSTEKLNMEYCNNVNLSIYFPIQLDDKTIVLYNNLNVSGYNLFNENDSFYNDICSTFTTINGSDITLKDRQNIYYNKSLNICEEEGCYYDYYDSKLKKVKCDCSISRTSIKKEEEEQSESENSFITTIAEIYYDKQKIKEIFTYSIENMNFQVMKCFELIFKLESFIKNVGCILLTVLTIIYLGLMIYYIIFGNDMLVKIMNGAFNKKSIPKRKTSSLFKDTKNKKDKGKRIFKIVKNSVSSLSEMSINKKLINKMSMIEDNNNKSGTKKKKEKKISIYNDNISVFQTKKMEKPSARISSIKFKGNAPPKNDKKPKITVVRKIGRSNSLKFNNQPIINNLGNRNNTVQKKDYIKKKFSTKEGIKNSISNKNNSEKIFKLRNSVEGKKKNKRKSSFAKKKLKRAKSEMDNNFNYLNKNKNFYKLNADNLNDEELNSLDYEEAIEIDKRSFMGLYWSLLKRRHLILFAFYPANDYNLMVIKISFFIISFSLYMTINGFFFSDESMHKVFEDNGDFNFLYQIPQILYSTIVSTIINMILKFLSLSEKNILDLKKERSIKAIDERLVIMKRYIRIKLVIYFVIGFLLKLFFWYFISTFCAVYPNTQLILIKNTLISFGLSMLYPLGYVLLPGLFRIPALRAKNKDKESLYKLSKLILMILI